MPPDEERLRAIGAIAANFNSLEYAMNGFAWLLVNRHDIRIGQIVLAGESFDRVLMRIRTLSPVVFTQNPELIERLQNWCDKARNIQARRNQVLHSTWIAIDYGADGQPRDQVAVRLSKSGLELLETRSVAELNDVADTITDVLHELTSILTAIPWLPRAGYSGRRLENGTVSD